MITRKQALMASVISGVLIGILYFILQQFLNAIPAWIVGLVVFIIAYLGMRGWKI